MGNSTNSSNYTSPFDKFLSESLLDEIFKIHFDKKVVLLGDNCKLNKNESVSFCDERLQAKSVQEKHFLNIYRVYDHTKKKWNNMKLLQIKNDQDIKEKIKKEIDKFYSMSNNRNFVKIEEILLNEKKYTKNHIQLIILEEALDFITLRDFLFIMINEFKSELNLVKY